MAHFPSLSDWRGILRWIATTLFALFIGTLAEENVRYVAEQEHWNEILMSGIRIMPDLHFYMKTKGFWFFFGLTGGIAAALWIVRFVPEAKPKFARSLNDTQVLFNSAIEPAHEAIMTVINAILQALRNHPNRSVQNLISVAR